MNYRIIKTENEFLSFKATWNDFYTSLEEKTVFQTFDWNYEWWKRSYSSFQLFILVCFNEKIEKPSMICPMMIDKKKCLRFIADTHSDYNDFLLARDDISTVYELSKIFHEVVNEDKNIDSIELKNLSQSSNYFGVFSYKFDDKQLLFQTNASSFISFVPGNNIMDCFSYMKAKKRNQIKRIYKNNDDLETFYYDKNQQDFPIEVVEEVLNDMVAHGLRKKDFLNETLLSVIMKLYQEGHLIIQVIKRNIEPLVVNFILKDSSGNRYLLWITLYKNIPRINIISYLLFIKEHCKNFEKTFILDFGRGLYDYKMTNFLPMVNLQFTFFYSKSHITYSNYLLKNFIKLSVKPFYKKHKQIINKILNR